MSTAAANNWDIVAGVIGVLGSIPVLCAIIHSQLPATKLSELDRTLDETETLFRAFNEEGLLKDVGYVVQTKRSLAAIRLEAEDCRVASHCAPTFSKQFKGMISGLSTSIEMVCKQVKLTRASIAETSSTERKRLLAEQGRASGEFNEDSTLDSRGANTYFLGNGTPNATFCLSFHIPTVEGTHAYGSRSAGDGRSISSASSHSRPSDTDDVPNRAAVERGVALFRKLFWNPFSSADRQHTAGPPISPAASKSSKGRARHKSRTYYPHAVRALLRRRDRDLAVQGRRHSILARLARARRLAAEPDCTSPPGRSSARSKGPRERGTCKLVLDGDGRGELCEEDDEWEDEILASMPELLVNSSPAVRAESRVRNG